MKLNSTLIKRTTEQFAAQAIPENHPAMGQLSELFGDHTFLLNGDGLSIVEPAGDLDSGSHMGKVYQLADWRDPERTSLAPHEPRATGVLIELGTDGGAKTN
jgi:hypothetical protein